MFDALQWTEFIVGAIVGVLAVASAEVARSRRPDIAVDVVLLWFLATLVAVAWRRGLGEIAGDAGWPLLVALVASPVAAMLGVRLRRSHGVPLLLTVLTVSSAGVYVNVPDTETIAMVGAGLGVLAIAWWLIGDERRWPLELAAAVLLITTLLVAGADGARGRPVAVIGVIGALGVVLIAQVVRLRRRVEVHWSVLLGVHVAIVVVASRLTIDRAATEAVAIVALALGAGSMLLLLAARPTRSAR